MKIDESSQFSVAACWVDSNFDKCPRDIFPVKSPGKLSGKISLIVFVHITKANVFSMRLNRTFIFRHGVSFQFWEMKCRRECEALSIDDGCIDRDSPSHRHFISEIRKLALSAMLLFDFFLFKLIEWVRMRRM